MGVIEAGATSAVVKTGSFFLSPLGKINLIVTGVFLVFLLGAGIFHSIDQHSLQPLWEDSILRMVASDHDLSLRIDKLESEPRPESPSSFFSKQMPVWFWFWLKWWWQTIISIWLIYFLVWMLYIVFKMINQDSMLRNILLAIAVFALLQVFTGMMMYTMSMAGHTLPSDKGKVFNEQMSHSIPLEGTFKLFKHIFNKELFYKVEAFTETGLGQAITNIPTNNSVNAT